MKILFLSQRFLLPMDTGGKIRTGKILEQLSQQHDITVVGNFEEAKDALHRTRMASLCRRFVPVVWREPERESLNFYFRVLKHSLSRFPVTALNDYSAALERSLLDTLAEERFDLAICDFVQSALLFRQVKGLPRLLFQHNVETRIAERHMRNAGNALTRFFWRRQYRRMQRFEMQAVRDFDAVIAVSEGDAEVFRTDFGGRNVDAIPTGVDLDFYQASPESAGAGCKELVFCGSMDWLPNEDAIRFFLEEIAPALDQQIPGWNLTVVGRNPSEWLKRTASENGRVTLTGWVDDVRPYLDAAAVSIVPLRIGGGTRMKIYESMAMSKAVVSTAIGAEGLAVSDGENIHLADTPVDFASAIVRLIEKEAHRKEMESAARALVEAHFGWARVADVFSELCEQTVLNYRESARSH